MNLDNRAKAILAVLSAQAIWGVAGPLVKIILANVPPFGLMFLRFLLATIILYVIYELKFAKTAPTFSWEDKKNIFLAGFFGAFVNIALYFWGQNQTSVIDAWVITSSGTLMVIAYSYIFLKERLAKIVYFGAGIAFVGTLIIIGTPIFAIGSGGLTGNLLMFASTLASALSFFPYKRLVDKFDPLILTYYTFLVSLPFAFPLFLWEYLQNPAWLGNISIPNLGILAYLVLGSSLAAYTLHGRGLKHLSPSLAATIGYASVVISVGLSIIFLHEKPTTYFFVGTAFIAIGLFLAETRHPSHPIHKLRRI